MSEKKLTKALRRWRKVREKRRFEKDKDIVWNKLKGKIERENIVLFNDDEKKKYFTKPKAIGTIACPLCRKPGILVANPDGPSGKPENNYIMRHNGKKSIMCDASLAHVQKLFKPE